VPFIKYPVGACCHQHRFISVDQNSAMHNCSLGEGLSIGCWKNTGTHDPNTVIYPTVPVFWGLISRGNRSLQVELEEIGSAGSLSFNSSASANVPVQKIRRLKSRLAIVESDDHTSP
jgi:hypothetical protein